MSENAEQSIRSRGSTVWQLGDAIRRPLSVAVGGIVFGLLPLVITATAAFIAWANGCELNEGNPNPCVVCGTDIGQTLYGMGVMAWFCVITLPVGGAVAGCGLVWAAAAAAKWFVLRGK